MTWPLGLSWTVGHREITTNPDGTTEELGVHGGPFYYNPAILGCIYFYMGFRPTATWGPGYGDEGWCGRAARFLKRRGWGNMGLALRRAR